MDCGRGSKEKEEEEVEKRKMEWEPEMLRGEVGRGGQPWR